MDDVVEYPCLKCPFDSYHRKVDTKMRTCDKLEMEKLYGEEGPVLICSKIRKCEPADPEVATF